MRSRDKRLPLDTWNTSGLQENVFFFLLINFLRLIHPEIILKELTLAQHKENKDQFHKMQGQGLYSQKDVQGDGVPMSLTGGGGPARVPNLCVCVQTPCVPGGTCRWRRAN